MKFSAKIEFDGNWIVGFIPNLCGCYVQAKDIKDIAPLMKLAVEIYRDNYKSRMEPFAPEKERPKINLQIQFQNISSNQLENILRRHGFNLEFTGSFCLLFRKTDYPFDRLLIPKTIDISRLILNKIFGSKNVIQLSSKENTFPISG